MNIQKIMQQLDTLLKECRLDDADKFLEENIALAEKESNISAQKMLLNEQIGFFRDCGKFPEALESVRKARELFDGLGENNTISYATTMLNCANAYRAAGEYDKAFEAYDVVKKIYDKRLPENDNRNASYLNNIALLYQETNQWEKACECLHKALDYVRCQNDDVRIAISCTNLAVSLFQLNHSDEALSLLEEADAILQGRSPSDFHYSAALAGFGDAYYKSGQYELASQYYEQALSEIELHMGKNNFYEIVSANLAQTYRKMNKSRPKFSGIELSRRFYYAFGEPMIKREFAGVLPKLAVGLAGEGSECLGYDDELSQDHDFGAGFCIWIPDDFPDDEAERLQKAYDALPKTYMGVKRIDTKEADGRVGVCRISSFFSRLTGLSHAPETEQEWLSVDEASLASICGGDIYMDNYGEMTERRKKLNAGYPENVRLRRLAQQLARMAQCGQYNYIRMRKRGENAAAQLYLAEFCKSAMQAAHLLSGKYAPYEKWLMRSSMELPGFTKFAGQVNELLIRPAQLSKKFNENSDWSCIQIRKICDKAAKAVAAEFDVEYRESVYLAETAAKLADMAEKIEQHDATVKRITELEWKAFDKVQNIGGRASCQDDWDTFSIMRSSQYSAWPEELLKPWCDYFEYELKNGRNLITEKYARMMESTDSEYYEKLKENLPEISEEFIKIREAIVSVQVSWMDEFAEKYPNLAANSRIIHTSGDSEYQTSYETYLRGEMTTYPEELLYEYGRWIIDLNRKDKNLAFVIMENTVHQYGYTSLDDAESKCV